MLEKKDLNTIKEISEEFFNKMTMIASGVEINSLVEEEKDVVNLEIKIDEPQILIGQGGQTLFEIQRLLRAVLNKKLQKVFYFNLDINEYKSKKIDYLKSLAKDLADQVSLEKQEKVLSPMSAYERRIIHAELAQRTDVVTDSQGDGAYRHVVIRPKQ